MDNHNESVKTPVRMVLWDYDAAPDGDGTYTVIDAKFPSVAAALRHRELMWCGDLYWGHIEDADGKTIETLRTRYEEEDDRKWQDDEDRYYWSEHEAKCDGCSICNRGGFPNDDED